MAKKKEKTIKSSNKNFPLFDNLSDKLLSLLDDNYKEITDLNNRDNKFQGIINRELELSKGISNGSIIDFARYIRSTEKDGKKNNIDSKDPYEILSSNSGELYSIFQDYYKNRYIEIQDLKFISKFIPALGEAVNTTVDYISSADDISDVLLRNINLPTNTDSEKRRLILEEIEKCEKKYNLKKRLKNHIYKNTVISGTTYVYAISYEKLFSDYSKFREENDKKTALFIKNSHAQESSYTDLSKYLEINGYSLDSNTNICMESCLTNDDKKNIIKESFNGYNQPSGNISNLLSNFNKIDTNIPYPVLESMDHYVSFEAFSKDLKNKSDNSVLNTGFVDAVKDEKDSKNKDKFDKIPDIYMKVLDFKRIIPIKIFDDVVGYYYIHTDKKKIKDKNIKASIPGILDTLSIDKNKKEDIINKMVDGLSDQILKKFNQKFVTNNSEFKKVIADCIVFNGFSDKDYKIQFIPKEDIIEFKINEDSDGNGQSILLDALFPAKLLLSILISKILNYINKSGNKTVMHSYKSSIDPVTSNHTQRIIRNLQESEANFTDMLSSNALFSKVSRNSNVHIPQSRDGKKLVEFETIEGQNIDLNTDFENKLEQMCIMATGVPSVIMEYVNQIDFAKQITTANIKFAGRISSYQTDLETPTTELYYRMLMASDMAEDLKKIISNHFEVILPRPKILSNTNTNDYLSTIQQMAALMAQVEYGENNQDAESDKAEYIKTVVKQNTPFIDWDGLEKVVSDALIKTKEKKKSFSSESDNMGV